MRRTRGITRWVPMLLLAAACPRPTGPGGESTRAPSTDDLAGITLHELAVRPSRPGAARYGGTPVHPLTPVETAIAERLTAQGVVHLPALSAMTRELAGNTPDEINVPPGLVDALMAWAGLVDPPPRLVVVELGGDHAGCDQRPSAACQGAIASLADQAAAVLGGDDWTSAREDLRFGVGVVGYGGGHTRMMVALLERAVALESIDAAVPSHGAVSLHGRLLGPRRQPSVEVVDAGGVDLQVAVALSVDGSFGGTLRCRADGTYQVEVLAEGPHGPEVAANFPVYCGVAPPTTFAVVVEQVGPEVSAAQIARANFIYLNEERERRGLPALAWDPQAANVARGHSQDMARNGFVGHRSPTTGDVTARFARVGLVGTVIRENVARGYGPKGIHDSLMRSPGHRLNMLATDVTHVGVGAVLGAAETNLAAAPRPVFATQNFYKKPGAGAPVDAKLAPTVRTRVDRLRTQAGLPALQWDDALSQIAARQAAAVAHGRKPPTPMQTEVFALGYVAMESHQLASIDFDALLSVALWREPNTAGIGLGVVRTPETRTQDAAFLAVVIVAQRP